MILAAVVLVGVTSAQPVAQDRSAALAKELTGLLQERKLDSIAARHPAAADQFVAALFFPGQLLVVWARTSAPAVLNEKLIRREFRDVYIDLNSASIPESRVMISDGGADGLRPRAKRISRSIRTTPTARASASTATGARTGCRKQDYMKIYTQADSAYITALEALLNELKKTS